MASVPTDNHRTLEAIKYTYGSLSILDQLALPHETKYVSVTIDGETMLIFRRSSPLKTGFERLSL